MVIGEILMIVVVGILIGAVVVMLVLQVLQMCIIASLFFRGCWGVCG